jgi:hypothetical protein
MKNFIDGWQKFINESGFNRIKNILQGSVASVYTVGFMTGWNPQAQQLARKDNRDLNKALMAWMRERGYGPIRIRGKFGNKERSMIIPNITREDMVEAGIYFDQESVIWGAKTGEDKFIFEYIEGNETKQRRDVVLFDDEVQAREDFYSQERQSAGRKFFIPFFDEQYDMEEGVEYDYDLPSLSEEQREQHKDLIKEINERVARTLDTDRTSKSRWHHRQLLRIKLRELKKKL